MTLEQANALLKKIGKELPLILEAVAVQIESYKPDGDWGGNAEEGDFWVPEDAHEAVANIAKIFRSMKS